MKKNRKKYIDLIVLFMCVCLVFTACAKKTSDGGDSDDENNGKRDYTVVTINNRRTKNENC